MKKIITLLFFVFVYHVGFGQWTNLNSPVIQERCHFFAVGVGDTGYIISGGGAGGYWSNADIFTPGNVWTAIANYPAGYNNGTNGFVIGDTIYAGTGAGGGYAYSNTFTEYDVHGQQWTGKSTSYNYQGRCSAVCFTIGDTGYTGGGLNSGYPTNNYSNNNPVNDFWRYVPATGVWDTIPHCPARGVGCNAVAFVLNGKAYVGTGGIQDAPGSQQFDPVADFWCYDPATNEWDSITPFGGGIRMSAIAFVTCGHAYVGTGCTDGGQSVMASDIWAFDPNGGAIGPHGPMGSWTRVSDFSGPARQQAGCFVIGTHAYIMCGTSSGYSITYDDIWEYTPTPAFYADTAACAGQLVQFTDTSLFFPDHWSWNFNGGTAVDSTAQNPAVIFHTPGVYSVTLTAWNDCDTGSTTDTSYITIAPYSGSVSITPDSPSVCNGETITLVASGGAGATYQWVGTSDTTDSISIHPTQDTTYQLIVGTGTCSKDTTISVKVNNAPPLVINPPSPAVECNGQPIVISVPASGSDYTWGPATGLSATTGSSVTANPTADITYSVSGLDSLGCMVTGTEAISIQFGPNKPVITESVTGDTLFSSAKNGNQWYLNGTPVNGANDSLYIISGLPVGDSITVSVINVGNGCSTTSDPFVTGINQLSVINSQLSIYPNPTNGMITVNISSSATGVKNWSLRVTDVLGRTLYTRQSLNYTNEVDLSNLPGGVYFITVIDNTARAVFPVVKQN